MKTDETQATIRDMRAAYKALRVGRYLRADVIGGNGVRIIGVGRKYIRCMHHNGRIIQVTGRDVLDWWVS